MKVVATALLAVTALSFFVFPGHTYLQQDTQIYIPILEHQWSGALARDLLVQHPHVNFTLYDELTDSLRWLTHASLQHVLESEQLLFRALGFLGVYLLALVFPLRRPDAIALTALFALGASIAAPAVLTIEYEPTPRAFAVPLIFLSIGLLLHRRDWLAGLAAAAAVLLHAPTAWPLGVAILAASAIRRPALRALLPMVAAALALFAIGHAQAVAEPQQLLGHLAPQQESLQRMRASYVYVSTWWAPWALQYLFFSVVCGLALWRIRPSRDVAVTLSSLVVVGLLSVPGSYLFLEQWHFSFVPQIQPARALLFVTASAILTASAAACLARRWEAFFWFGFVLLVSAHARFFELPGLRVAIVVALAAAVLAIANRFRPYTALVLAPALLLAANITPYRNIQTPDLDQLSQWARQNTAPHTVFAFPDAERSRAPGWFRSRALRAVYVDWKGGGQVNYLAAFSDEWWRRWKGRAASPLPSGIDFAVRNTPVPGLSPVYRNSSYVVYRVSPAT